MSFHSTKDDRGLTSTRLTGQLETFFAGLGSIGTSVNREHATFFTVLQVLFPSTVTDVEPYILRTWQAIGRSFPAYHAEISPPSPDQEDRYQQRRITVDPFDENAFRDTFQVHPDSANVDALFSVPVGSKRGANCHWLPKPKQVVIRTSHWRTDGLGLVVLSNIFLSTLATVLRLGLNVPLERYSTQFPETPSLTPSLEDLVSKYIKDDVYRPAEADNLASVLTEGGFSIGLPTKAGSSTAPPTACGRAALRLDTDSSTKFSTACRAQGVSVTSALNAALIRVTGQFPQEPGADSYVIFAPFNFRQLLAEAGAKECLQPSGLYIIGLPIRIPEIVKQVDGKSIATKPFKDIAHEISAYYSQDLSRYKKPGEEGSRSLNLLPLAGPYMERAIKVFSSIPSPGFPYPKTPVISSLGKMDSLIQHEYSCGDEHKGNGLKLQVTDFWLGSDSSTPFMAMHCWSWGGELTLSAAWNDSFYTREFAVEMLGKVLEELREGLGMSQVSYRTVHHLYEART